MMVSEMRVGGMKVGKLIAGGLGILALGLILVAAGRVPGGSAAKGTIRIKGSDTMLLLVGRWAEGFMAAHPGVVVDVQGGSTSKGIRALIAGTVDIASASRPLRPEEARLLVERHQTLGYSVLAARDALSVYVHPSNRVADLSLEQLRGIFTGKIRRWSQVGGDPVEITVLNRNPASGSRLFFAERVLGGEDFFHRAKIRGTTASVVAAVRADPRAIGFGGLGYADGVGLCAVDGVSPSREHVRDGTYPISRYLYLYTAVPPMGLVKEWVDWVLGREGQEVVTRSGYIALHS